MIIYCARNKITRKVYIGQSIRDTPVFRIRCHMLSKYYFGAALRKYGLDAFEISVIDRAETREQLNAKERFWIKTYNSLAPNGYNLTTGGEGGFKRCQSTILKMLASRRRYFENNPEAREQMLRRLAQSRARSKSPEVKEKIAQSLREYYANHPEAVKAMAERNKGRLPWHTGLTKADPRVAKMSLGKIGKPRPDFAENLRKWAKSPNYVNSMQGRKRPDLAERNRATKGRKISLETRAKMSAAHKARGISPEHRAAINAALRARRIH